MSFRQHYVIRAAVSAAMVAGSVKVLLWFLRQNPALRAFLWSKLAKFFTRNINDGIRRDLQALLVLYRFSVRKGHPHAPAANSRNSAAASMREVVDRMGYRPYVISPSEREDGVDASRCIYQLNDFKQRVRDDPITDRHIIVVTDADYYLDWSYWLQFGRPVLLYTFVPETTGGPVDNGLFWIKDNQVVTLVSGGGRYTHRVWDYHRDSLWSPVASKFGILDSIGQCLGLWDHLNAVSFSVDQFRVGRDRRIISLVPFTYGPKFFVEDFETKIAYQEFSVRGKTEDYNILRVLGDEPGAESMISVSKQGIPVSATLTEAKFIGTAIRYAKTSTKTLADVVRFVGDDLSKEHAAVLADYLSETVELKPRATVHKPGEFAKHFLCDGPNRVEDGKRYARVYAAPPLSEEAVFPVEGSNNDLRCVKNRIDIPQRTAAQLMKRSNPSGSNIPEYRYAEYAREFVALLVPTTGVGRPIDVADVIEKQSLPRQRVRSKQRLWDLYERFVVSAFQKREAYSSPNDPRNISSVPTTHTLGLSTYTLAFKEDCLKAVSWYMPGKTPVEVVTSLQDLAANNVSLVEGDYSRFDGTITRWLRERVEFAAYLRWCHPDSLGQLRKLLNDELNPRAYTKTGLKYEPGCSRLSGSPLTTDGNTIINAFVAYATCREAKYSPGESFGTCGVFYGDDSLMTDKVIMKGKLDDLTRVAGVLGLQLKATERARGQPVNFLSRVFPDIWNSPASVSDPLRALLKIHTTVNITDDIEVCGFNKASAYLVTDGKTPLIRSWCQAYLRLLGKQFDQHDAKDLPYWYTVPEYRAAPWPQDDEDKAMDLVAGLLGVGPDELREHCKTLDSYQGSIDAIPLLVVSELDPKVSCSVDGEFRHPGDSSTQLKKLHVSSGTIAISKRDNPSTSKNVSRSLTQGGVPVHTGGPREVQPHGVKHASVGADDAVESGAVQTALKSCWSRPPGGEQRTQWRAPTGGAREQFVRNPRGQPTSQTRGRGGQRQRRPRRGGLEPELCSSGSDRHGERGPPESVGQGSGGTVGDVGTGGSGVVE
nr:MAG: RNA-dependent RNA polymerase [Wufeng shrew nodavirus 2]